jgi:hypothetical protein
MKTRKTGLWEAVTLKPDTLYRAEFSTLSMWLRRRGRDWFLASRRLGERKAASPLAEVKRIPPDLSFSRWVAGGDASTVRFVPAMPDRPLVVRPAVTLKVAPGEDGRLFVGIPVWVRIVVLPAGITLGEMPATILSNTWFGEPTSGELCYALRAGATEAPEQLDIRSDEAICPITIRNRAPRELDLQRLCVRVEHLEVYGKMRRLWTNELEVRFTGEERSSQITIGNGPPGYAEKAEKLCEARRKADSTFLKQSFSFLRSLTGF